MTGLYYTWPEWEARTHGSREEYDAYVNSVKEAFADWAKRHEEASARTWTAQLHNRQGWENLEAPTYRELREQIDGKAGLYGPVYVKDPSGKEYRFKGEVFGIPDVEARPEPLIDEDEEADA